MSTLAKHKHVVERERPVNPPGGNPRIARLVRLGRQRDFSLSRFGNALAGACRREERAGILSQLLTDWTGLSFSPEEAEEHWRQIECLFPILREKLGRPLGLQTLLLHHFHSLTGSLKDPRLVSERDLSVLRVDALTDPLTGLYNRRFILEHLSREIARAERARGLVSVAFMDLKSFKAINDRFGHAVGDSVLVRTAGAIRESLRSIDAGCRWGGDEFVVVLPNTSFFSAFAVVERIRKKVAGLALPEGGQEVGMHYGIASYPMDGKSVDFLLKIADLRLYQCREQLNFTGLERRNHPRFSPEEMNARVEAQGTLLWTAPIVDVGYRGVAIRAPRSEKWPPRWNAEIFRRFGSERYTVRLRALYATPLPGGGVRVGCLYV